MKILKRIAVVLAGVIVLLAAILFGGSEWKIRAAHAAPLPAIAADRSAAGIAEGNRIGHIFGCAGCHGGSGQGNVLADIPMVITLAPPPLARATAPYSDSELARLIRYGVKRDGSSVFFMPSKALGHISDADLARIIGWLRTLRPLPTDSTVRMGYGPLARFGLLTGKLTLHAQTESDAPKLRPTSAGSYFVHSGCLACHALHTERKAEDDGRTIPALATIGAAYDPAAFHKLLHTGVGASGRDLGLMKRVARGDLSHLTDGEMDQIQTYLAQEYDHPTEQ